MRARTLIIAVPMLLGVVILLTCQWLSSVGSDEGKGSFGAERHELDCELPESRLVSNARDAASDENPPANLNNVPLTTKDPRLTAFVDRDALSRVTGDITPRIPRVRFEEDMPAVVSVLMDTDDSDTARNEAANLLLRSGYDGLIADLTTILAKPEEKPRFRSFCVQKLWENARRRPEDRGRTVTILQGLVKDKDVPVRREALLALVRMRDPKGKETAVEWLTAENADGVRDAAIRCAQKLGLREHIPTIRKYLRDDSEVVRIAAIVTLSQWGDEGSRPAIKEATKSESFRLRRCAEMALKRLARAAEQPDAPAPDADAPAVPPKAGKDGPRF